MRISWWDVFLMVAGIIIIYQLIKKILGGSWGTEALIIALLFFNLGLTLKLNSKFDRHIMWHKFKVK
tara:strand:+ start:6124 stop:6324 length:201 start_codon:yes stop_codon:yes gene_type:complete